MPRRRRKKEQEPSNPGDHVDSVVITPKTRREIKAELRKQARDEKNKTRAEKERNDIRFKSYDTDRIIKIVQASGVSEEIITAFMNEIIDLRFRSNMSYRYLNIYGHRLIEVIAHLEYEFGVFEVSALVNALNKMIKGFRKLYLSEIERERADHDYVHKMRVTARDERRKKRLKRLKKSRRIE